MTPWIWLAVWLVNGLVGYGLLVRRINAFARKYHLTPMPQSAKWALLMALAGPLALVFTVLCLVVGEGGHAVDD